MADPEAGFDYASALRAYVAAGIDVAYTRELDSDVVEVAARAVENGMLLFASVHTTDAFSALLRLENLGLERWRILDTVTLVVAQRLLRRLCPFCSVEVRHSPAVLERLGVRLEPGAATRRPVGCRACRDSGYRRKVLVAETLAIDDHVKEACLSSPGTERFKAALLRNRGPSLRQAALGRVLEGVTSLEEALRETPDDGTGDVAATAED